jgi:hypothetical protein
MRALPALIGIALFAAGNAGCLSIYLAGARPTGTIGAEQPVDIVQQVTVSAFSVDIDRRLLNLEFRIENIATCTHEIQTLEHVSDAVFTGDLAIGASIAAAGLGGEAICRTGQCRTASLGALGTAGVYALLAEITRSDPHVGWARSAPGPCARQTANPYDGPVTVRIERSDGQASSFPAVSLGATYAIELPADDASRAVLETRSSSQRTPTLTRLADRSPALKELIATESREPPRFEVLLDNQGQSACEDDEEGDLCGMRAIVRNASARTTWIRPRVDPADQPMRIGPAPAARRIGPGEVLTFTLPVYENLGEHSLRIVVDDVLDARPRTPVVSPVLERRQVQIEERGAVFVDGWRGAQRDTTGNRDGRIQGGETGMLTVTFQNQGNRDARDLILTLVAQDPYLKLVKPRSQIKLLPAGDVRGIQFELRADPGFVPSAPDQVIATFRVTSRAGVLLKSGPVRLQTPVLTTTP